MRHHEAYYRERIPPGEWIREARCRGFDTNLFFPERGEDTRPAKAICRECPVREECLDHALVNGERKGIWGGLSERERRRIRRSTMRRTA